MDINQFRKLGMQPQQLFVIEEALRKKVSKNFLEECFTDTRMNALQMEILLNAYLNGLDYKRLADFNIPEQQMEKIYLSMLEDKKQILKEQEKKNVVQTSIKASKLLYNGFIFLLLVGVMIILYIVVYPIYQAQQESLEIQFKKNKVTIQYKDRFDPKENILSYSNPDKHDLMISVFDPTKLGLQTIDVTVSNGLKKIKQSFQLEIVDTQKPSLILKKQKESIYLNQVDAFDCKDYIDSVSDNYDNNLIDSVTCHLDNYDIGKHEVIYTIQDSSKNTTTQTLQLIIEENPKPKPAIQANNTNSSYDQQNVAESTTNSNHSSTHVPAVTSSSPFISGVGDITVGIDSDLGDLVFRLTSNITASGSISVDYSAVNLSAAGSYPVYYRSSDGASMTVTVYVQ